MSIPSLAWTVSSNLVESSQGPGSGNHALQLLFFPLVSSISQEMRDAVPRARTFDTLLFLDF